MGYRSDVAYRIVVSDKVILNEVIAKVMMLGGYVCQALKECQIEKYDDLDHPECYINFFASDVKWYPDFPEVKAFNQFVSNFLELAEQEEIQWAYEFVRMGEDSDDVEETYSDHSHYLIRISRVIDSEFN